MREYVNDVGEDIDNKLKNEFLLNIIRNRHQNLKKLMYKFQRLLIRLLNSYVIKKKEDKEENTFQKEENDYFINKFDSLVELYRKKVNNLNVTSSNGSHQVFKHWKGISEITKIDNIKDVTIDNNTINYEKINKYDENGNMLLFYIIDEWTSLLNFNENKMNKSSLCFLIIDFINVIFELYNEEKFKYNMEFKQFYYFIHSATYVDSIKDTVGITEGVYEEFVDENKEVTEEEKEALEDAIEEEGALDVEGDEIDYAAFYERNDERGIDNQFSEGEFTYRDYKHILSINDYYS
jgi:hypothetical protein